MLAIRVLLVERSGGAPARSLPVLVSRWTGRLDGTRDGQPRSHRARSAGYVRGATSATRWAGSVRLHAGCLLAGALVGLGVDPVADLDRAVHDPATDPEASGPDPEVAPVAQGGDRGAGQLRGLGDREQFVLAGHDVVLPQLRAIRGPVVTTRCDRVRSRTP